jgi:hypothetical protein
MDDSDDFEVANVTEWPWMPLEPAPLFAPPRIGQWAWLIPEKVRNSSFHEVVALHSVVDDDEQLELVTVACHRTWPLDRFCAAVEENNPVLGRTQDGTHAACQNCESGGRGRRTYWDRLLERS